ncbi:MAG: hypothetical protein LQ340_007238, partial [Diploschistes diacapsis]
MRVLNNKRYLKFVKAPPTLGVKVSILEPAMSRGNAVNTCLGLCQAFDIRIRRSVGRHRNHFIFMIPLDDSSMFESSPRPKKRQKIGSTDASPSQAPRSSVRKSSRRSILTYGSRHKAKSAGNGAFDSIAVSDEQEENHNELRNGASTDSAYHSMSTAQDELEELSKEIDTPSTRGREGRKTASKKEEELTNVPKNDDSEQLQEKERADITNGKKEAAGRKGAEEAAAGESDLEGDTIVVRSSGRTRKKTWKSAAAEAGVVEAEAPKARATSAKQSIAPNLPNSAMQQERKLDNLPTSTSNKQNNYTAPKTPTKGLAIQSIVTPQSKRKRGRPPKTSAPLEESLDIDTSRIISRSVNDERTSSKTDQTVDGVEARSPTPKKKRHDAAQAQEKPIHDKATTTVISNEPGQLETSRVDLKKLVEDPAKEGFMTMIKDGILGYLTGRCLKPIVGADHEKAYQKVFQVLEQTVAAGEGNSMLLIGARGTAKTTVLETALSHIGAQHQNDFHVVRLNGFFQTDDKLALREIWRQLGKEMKIEDGSMDDRGNYADTLSSLLALLSQPGELLSSSAGEREMTSKSVIFVLNEFDLFTSHPRQTLLYNLFDIAQSRKAPIAVFGLTTRIDIVESLEKRVKSRFSHRYVYLSQPKTFSAYIDICKAFLLALPPDSEGPTDTSPTSTLPNHFATVSSTHGPNFHTFQTS